MIKLYFLCVIFNYLALALGSYPCLCCYKPEAFVYKEKTDASEHLGSVYEFDCKPIYPLDDVRSTDFFDVQYKNQIGYIKNTPELSIESCPGFIPLTDQVNVGNTIETTIIDVVQTTTPVPTIFTTKTPAPTATSITTPLSTTRPTTMPLPTTTPTTTTALPTTTQELITRPTTKSVTTTTPTTTAAPTTIPTTTPKPPTTAPPAVCSGSWVKYQNSCYLFKFDQRHGQHRSSSLCEAENSHLVFINSKEEQQFIANHIENMAEYHAIDHHLRNDDNRLHLLSVWIGGIYDHHSWSWVDPSKDIKTSLSYTNFWKHLHSSDQKVCAAMNGDHHFQWRDFRCTDSFYYICEKSV